MQTTDPNANPPTTHTYDALHRLQQTVDALSGVTQYAYDVHDRLTQVTAPNGATTTYDTGNRVLTQTDPTDHTVTYTRDTAGRITAVDLTIPDGTTHAIASAIAYRADGGHTAATVYNGLPETRISDLQGRLTQLRLL